MKHGYWGALLALAAGISAAPSQASAEPFVLRYDPGYMFPEQEGWERHTHDPEGLLSREVDGTVLRLDTSGSLSMPDFYYADCPGLDPTLGEELRVAWRMRTLETQPDYLWSDVGITVSGLSSGYAVITVGPDYVSQEYGQGGLPEHVYYFTAGAMHQFEVRTQDMATFSLYVDETLAFASNFDRPAETGPFRVYFGDAVSGRRSVSEWDYVQVAGVPEPAGLCAAAVALLVVLQVRKGIR